MIAHMRTTTDATPLRRAVGLTQVNTPLGAELSITEGVPCLFEVIALLHVNLSVRVWVIGPNEHVRASQLLLFQIA